MSECPICLNKIKCNYKKVQCCKKTFHKKCLNKWLETNNTCPLCREVIIYQNPIHRRFKITKYLICFDKKIILLTLLVIGCTSGVLLCFKSGADDMKILGIFTLIVNFMVTVQLIIKIVYFLKKIRQDLILNVDEDDEVDETELEEDIIEDGDVVLIYDFE